MSEGPTHKRRRALESLKGRAWDLISEYQEKLLLTDDPREREDFERQIADLRRQLKKYQAELTELEESAEKPRPPGAIAEGVMPLPPQPYFVHPYPLQEYFTGRVSERQMLTEWLTGDQRPVFVLEALGGMGKSSVAWVWAKRDVADQVVPGLPEDSPEVQSSVRVPDDHKPEGLLFWSFYKGEGGGTFHLFLERAITYCSDGTKTAQNYVSEIGPEDKRMDYAAMQADLVQILQQRRFLLVWDGAERLLREYGGLDATIREERDVEELDPDARDTIDPAVARFLRDVAGQASSRLLLTSRLYPRDLEDLAGAKKKELTGLGEDDAAAYLQARGIRGTRAELVSAATQYDFHPLSLTNLAAALLDDFDEEGDISAAPNYDETETLKNRREHILERAYERRTPHRRELVSRLAAMRGAIPKEVVRLLAEDMEDIQPETMGRDLSELVRHGLLRHPSPEQYDFHPVVRRYCYQRLEDKEKVHHRLIDYFSERAAEVDEVTSLEDLAPLIELYHHTVSAGGFDDACDLLYDQLGEPLYFRFGAYQTRIELLRALFPDGEDHLPRLKKEGDQAWTLNSLANSYSLSGQPRRAVRAFKLAVKLAENLEIKENIAIGLGNLADMAQLPLGELAAAERNLQRSIELYREIENESREAVGHGELGRLLAYQGAFDKAEQHLTKALEVLDAYETNYVSVFWAYRALRALLMGDAKDALEAARRARELADVQLFERDIIRAEWLLGAARVTLASEERSRQNEHLAEAETHLTEALTRCRRINLVDQEPDILLAWARWHHASDNAQQAQYYTEEALAIADRSEYRLNQADIHNFLARLALDAGDQEAARQHAEVARERAWCDGPPHSYKPALDEAERMLKEAEEM
ncbi:MAG: tetratricopeptide repeat protein [Nitrospinae bacterium]|nr:tetratricopeptide repeat protein [Nitrospinota bacterium]